MSYSSTPEQKTHLSTPVSSSFELEVVAGLTVLGLLIINIWDFGGFTINEQTYFITGTHGGNFKLWAAISMLFEGKMASLFSMLAGAGLLVLLKRKEDQALVPKADVYIRRQMWLSFFGLVNAFILLFPGDILFMIGIAAIIMFGFTRMSPRALLIAAVVCMLIFCGKNYWNYADDKTAHNKYLAALTVEKKFRADSLDRALKDSISKPKDSLLLGDWKKKKHIADSIAKKQDTLTRKEVEAKSKWEGMIKSLRYDGEKSKGEVKSMHNSYLVVWSHLMPRTQQKESYWFYRIGIWDISSMMFLGMALFGFGFFSRRFSGMQYFLVGAACFLAGIGLAYYRIKLYDARVIDYETYISTHALPYNFFYPIEKMLLAVGYASLVLWFMQWGILNWITKGLSAIGKTAITNYLLQSLLCSIFFYGYGFGYFGKLQQWELYFIVIEVWIIQLLFSVFWLRYYQRGPVEWLWNCLVYRRWISNRKVF